MPTAFSSALYYPYIDIKNERWLRSASLFWDNIRTIVPESHRDPYSSKFARELCDEGVLIPVRVSSEMDEIEGLTDTVLDFLTDPSSAGVLYSTDGRPTSRLHPEKISHELRELMNIHPEKLPYLIRSHLDRTLNEGWYQVAPGFANFYMTLLATKLSERLGLGLITESSASDQLAIAVYKGNPHEGNGLSGGAHRRYGRHFDAHGPRRALPKDVAPGMLIDLVVQGIELPKTVKAKDLLIFKREHQEELAIFRRELNRLMADLPKEPSIDALRQAVSDQYQANVLPALRSLKQSLQAQSWDTGLNGILKAAFFTAAPASAAIMAGAPSSIALLAGAGVSLTASAVLMVNQRRKTRSESPYAYLLSLERQWR